MDRVSGGRRRRTAREDDRLAEIDTLAWLLDNSIPVPATGGRRIGLDAIIGLVPGFGDLLSGGLGLYVIWRASRTGAPGVVVARMLANTALDMAIGSIPVIGDAFDLWFKANTRNLRLMRRYAADPGASTRGEWTALGLMALGVVVVIALMVVLLVAAFAALGSIQVL